MNKNALSVVLLAFVVFGIGFFIGRSTADESFGAFANSIERGAENTIGSLGDRSPEGGAQSGSGTSVNTANLSDAQRSMLKSFGIDADNITITPEMVACAEAKLGAARIEEIKNGASPTFTEGASLVACYR